MDPATVLKTLLLLSVVSHTAAQFPKVCAGNATTEEGICCPIPPGYTEPCGGAGRGYCQRIPENDDNHGTLEPGYENDDRLNWPHRFFHYACSCHGNFFGYMCQECAFGYRGKNCDIKHMVTRKEANKLTKTEREQFRRVVDHSKNVPSDYVILKNVYDQDPSTNPVFTDVSVYDFFVFAHQYSARHTIVRDENNQPTKQCKLRWDVLSPLDFAHKGTAFPMWHRALLLLWERELQKASGEEDFIFPYWDWTDQGDQCNVCTNELVGATNTRDPNAHLDKHSPFSDWTVLCPLPSLNTRFCYLCEPNDQPPRLTREIRKERLLPDKRQVDYALGLPQFDLPPYNNSAPKESFRNVLFGAAGENGLARDTSLFLLHSQGHAFFKGPMSSVPNAVSDPIFIFHHMFVDKLFEIWLRKYQPKKSVLPDRGAPPGHNRNAYLVPFFPVLINADYFTDSRNLGYDFDDMVEDTKVHGQLMNANQQDVPLTHTKPLTWVLSGVLGAALLALLVSVVVYMFKRRRRPVEDESETSPLLRD